MYRYVGPFLVRTCTHLRMKFVFNHLNQMPKESHDVDFSRIKPWYLDGLYVVIRL